MEKFMVGLGRVLLFWAVVLMLPAVAAAQTPPTPEPPPTPAPNQLPAITLLGEDPLVLPRDCPFADPGAIASDAEDGDLTKSITVTGLVNINAPETYTLTYSVNDSGGLPATTTRQFVVVNIVDPTCAPLFLSEKPEGKAFNLRLLLDSRVVELTKARHPILVILFSSKPLFFKGLKIELRALGHLAA